MTNPMESGGRFLYRDLDTARDAVAAVPTIVASAKHAMIEVLVKHQLYNDAREISDRLDDLLEEQGARLTKKRKREAEEASIEAARVERADLEMNIPSL